MTSTTRLKAGQEVVIKISVEPTSSTESEFKEIGERTPSQKLRLALRDYHLKQGGTDANFEVFYKSEIERIISVIKRREGK